MKKLQTSWDARAALNFMLGGAGAGLMAASALIASPAPPLLSMALVAAGLAAVWLETGRKLRAINVLFNPFTSWMTRESFMAVVFFALGIAGWAIDEKLLVDLAGLAALAFLWCQGRILRAAKGIPAWRAPEVVPLVVSTGLAEGLGLALFFDSGIAMLVLFALALAARALAWRRYFAAAKPAALDAAGRLLLRLGTFAALGLAFAAYWVPASALLAGAAALAAGWNLKFRLITRAAFRQSLSLPHLPIRGTR
ncbi:MAG: phenylacetyl-CoA:acceptor oxidoreductase [Betaproteobacteria bacterium]